MTVHVVFVCLGNICRSPMAEAVMKRKVKEAGLDGQITVDSVGTGSWHVGEAPCDGTIRVLRANGLGDFRHKARQLSKADFRDADYLIALDSSNLRDIRRMGDTEAEVKRLLDYAPDASTKDVPDPYYHGGFEGVYELVDAGTDGLLAHIRETESV